MHSEWSVSELDLYEWIRNSIYSSSFVLQAYVKFVAVTIKIYL